MESCRGLRQRMGITRLERKWVCTHQRYQEVAFEIFEDAFAGMEIAIVELWMIEKWNREIRVI